MGRKAIKAFVSSFARMGSGVVRLMLLGKNTKNMENAKELTKKYGSPVEEIAII